MMYDKDAGHKVFMEDVYECESRLPGGVWSPAGIPWTDVVRTYTVTVTHTIHGKTATVRRRRKIGMPENWATGKIRQRNFERVGIMATKITSEIRTTEKVATEKVTTENWASGKFGNGKIRQRKMSGRVGKKNNKNLCHQK